MSGLTFLAGSGGGSPGAPAGAYQYNGGGTFDGGELTRQSATVTSFGADSATPAAHTLRGQNSRGGTDTDVAGESVTIASGSGTGNAAATSILFQTPTVGASGSVQQVLATRLTVSTTAVETTVPIICTSSQSGIAARDASSNVVGAFHNYFGGCPIGIALGSTSSISWGSTINGAADSDTVIARMAAGSIRQGQAPSATPVAQTFTIGEASRPATDANVGGSSGTLRSGLGTGTGTESSLIFQTPTVAGAGTGTQTYATRLTVATAAVTATVPFLVSGLGAGVIEYQVGNAQHGLALALGAMGPLMVAGTASTMRWDGGTGATVINAAYMLQWASSGMSSPDLSFGRLAAASFRQGSDPSATPVAQTFTLGEASRPGTDADIGGASGTLRSGLGTGTGTASSLAFQTPDLVASGSTTQTYATRLTVATASVTSTVPVVSAIGTITADAPIFSGTATWNNGAVAFTAIKLNVTKTAAAAGSYLMDLQVGSASQFRVDDSGVTLFKGGNTTAGNFLELKYLEETISVANGVTTQDGSAGFIPANSNIIAFRFKVNAQPGNTASFSAGVAGDTDGYLPTGTSTAVNTTVAGFVGGTAGANTYSLWNSAAARTLRFTFNAVTNDALGSITYGFWYWAATVA